jgi:hypothetical protein
VTLDEMEEARDKVRWGRERRSLAMSDKEKIGTAWHEAGHAYLNMVLPHTNPLHKVTIIPRGPYLGATMYLPEGDKYSTQKKEALANLIVTMGGRIAESFHSDDVSNGASGDIRQATSLARHMVCEWGMSEQLGMVEYGEGDSPVFLARDMAKSRNYSEETARVIDSEIKRFIDEAYEHRRAHPQRRPRQGGTHRQGPARIRNARRQPPARPDRVRRDEGSAVPAQAAAGARGVQEKAIQPNRPKRICLKTMARSRVPCRGCHRLMLQVF